MRTGSAIPANLFSIKPLSLNRVDTGQNNYTKLLGQFPELTRPTTKGEPVKHGITHKIVTKGHPVFARPRRLAPDKLVTVKREFDDMIKLGVIEPSDSEWSSALHMVPNENGDWRPCGDYRSLNAQTLPDWYPIPHLQDFTIRLAGSKFFSKIDLVRAYYQIPVESSDVHKTVGKTPFGFFNFTRTPIGLRNSGQTFQRFIDHVTSGLDFVFVYLDDHRTHKEHLKILFKWQIQHRAYPAYAPPPRYWWKYCIFMHFLNEVKLTPLFAANMWLTPPPLTHSGSATVFSRIRDNHRTREMSVRYYRIQFPRTSC